MNPAAQPSALEMFFPFIIILVIFYFMIFRPQSKRLKEHDKFLTEIKRGDSVVTASGILGTIDGMNDQIVTLDLGDGTKMKILKKQIAGSQAAYLEKKNG